ncbi:hypothetical protein DWX73_09570 [Coprococcus sp. AF21-14LB]|nr:hypothetical protein DWX73_09570 [Coprococcus sp. AF21-14LB]
MGINIEICKLKFKKLEILLSGQNCEMISMISKENVWKGVFFVLVNDREDFYSDKEKELVE